MATKSKADLVVKTEYINLLCRICLQEGNVPLFNGESELCENVCILADIEIHEDDNYPKHLCDPCFITIQSAINLRLTAKKTERILKDESHRLFSNLQQDSEDNFTEPCSPKSEQEIPAEQNHSTSLITAGKTLLKNDNQELLHKSDDGYNFNESVVIKKVSSTSAFHRTKCITDKKIDILPPSVYSKYFEPTAKDGLVKCKMCSKVIQTGSRKEHYALHDPNAASRYQCGVCGLGFRQRGSYNIHMKKWHSVDDPSKSKSNIDMTLNMKNDNIQELLQENSEELIKNDMSANKEDGHELVKANEKKSSTSPIHGIKCITDKKIDIVPPSVYSKYFEPTAKDGLVKCKMCSKVIQTGSRKEHYALHDPNAASRYQCGLCGIGFRQRGSYNIHMKKWHPDDNPSKSKSKIDITHNMENDNNQELLQVNSEELIINDISIKKEDGHDFVKVVEINKKSSTSLIHRINCITDKKIDILPPSVYSKYFEPTAKDGLVKCKMCSKVIQTGSRKEHYALHDPNAASRYQCAVCGLGFRQRVSYNIHIKKWHSVDDPSKSKSNIDMTLNMKNDNIQELLQGNSQEKSKNNIHINKQDGYDFVEAVENKEVSSTSTNCTIDTKNDILPPSVYSKYFEPTAKEGAVQCKLCSKVVQMGSRKEHYALHDPNAAFRYQCGVCGLGFRQRGSYNNHMKKGHSVDGSPKSKSNIDMIHNMKNDNNQELLQVNSEEVSKNNMSIKKQGGYELLVEAFENKKVLTISPLHITNSTIDIKNDILPPSVYSKYFEPTSKEGIVKCKMCSKVVQMGSRKEHYALHDPNAASRYQCGVCRLGFRQRSSYNRHNKIRHSVKDPLTCKICLYRGESVAQITSHMHAHSQGKHDCHVCLRQFKDRNQLLNHQLTHKENTKNKPIYDKYFKDIGYVSNKNMFECQICHKTIQKLSRLTHYRTAHDQSLRKRHLCDICGKSFIHYGNYVTHKSTHINDFPFKCKLCPYRGRNSGLLYFHMRIHSERYNFKCDLCSMQCKYKSNLIRHIRRHNKPEHECNVCKRKFYEKFGLNRHFRMRHLGQIERIACEICHKEYSNRRNLLKHQFKVHNRKKYKHGKEPHYMAAEFRDSAKSN